MKIPTISEALAALDANPQAARKFDKASATEARGMTRRAAVALALEALATKRAATASAGRAGTLKEKAKAAQAELERAHRALTAPKAGKSEDVHTISVRESLRRNREAEERERRQAERERREQREKASTAAPAPSRFADAADSYLHQAATHRSSPAADRAEAINELNRRGATVSPEGIISRSIRGGRAAKNS